MLSKIEPIFFVLFVFFIVWMAWVPMSYMFKNLMNSDFDFFKDVSFYWDTVKTRYKSPVGKFAISYIALYAIFCAFKFFFLRGK
jgi:hypothetical protein